MILVMPILETLKYIVYLLQIQALSIVVAMYAICGMYCYNLFYVFKPNIPLIKPYSIF